MAKKDTKTKETDADVAAFVAKIEPLSRRIDAETLISLFAKVTGETPKMWGPSIIGFGRYHYVYESGRTGDSCRTGFSPRKANLVLYLHGEYDKLVNQSKLQRLGKCKTGKGCLYINRLAEIDLAVLEEMIGNTHAYMAAKYPD